MHEGHDDVPVMEGRGAPGSAAEVLCVDPDQRARDRRIELPALQRALWADGGCGRTVAMFSSTLGATRLRGRTGGAIRKRVIARFDRHCYLWLTRVAGTSAEAVELTSCGP